MADNDSADDIGITEELVYSVITELKPLIFWELHPETYSKMQAHFYRKFASTGRTLAGHPVMTSEQRAKNELSFVYSFPNKQRVEHTIVLRKNHE